jgi:betaine-aldehyde dehydrogenase
VRAARHAFDNGSWGRTTAAERAAVMRRFADALERRGAHTANLVTRENGMPIGFSEQVNGGLPAFLMRMYADIVENTEFERAQPSMVGSTIVRREPLGVVGAIVPWNFPQALAAFKIAPALAAGNTVVLKPSDTTPVSAALVGEIAAAVLPPGVLNVVCGDRETGRLVVAHPSAAMVSITGSTGAGRQVAASAAQGVKRVHLELGGKAPAVVFADADLDAAVDGIVGGAFFNAGQDCTAVTRILLAEEIADRFTERLVAAVREIHPGPPADETAFYGPLNNADQLARVSAVVAGLPAHAQVLVGGHRVGDDGFFFAPTVVDRVRQDDAVVQEETFGPVVTVQRFGDEAEALRLANGVAFGLAASVWTRDHATAHRCTVELDAGCVWVNAHIPLVAEMPHGGFKQSGYGKDLSHYGLEDYTRVKHVMHAFGEAGGGLPPRT